MLEQIDTFECDFVLQTMFEKFALMFHVAGCYDARLHILQNSGIYTYDLRLDIRIKQVVERFKQEALHLNVLLHSL